MHSTAHQSAPRATGISFHPIKWLIRQEYNYRQHCKLKATSDHHLADMGITRQQANQPFYRWCQTNENQSPNGQ